MRTGISVREALDAILGATPLLGAETVAAPGAERVAKPRKKGKAKPVVEESPQPEQPVI